MNRLIILALLVLFFSACNQNPLKIDVSDVKVDLTVKAFEKDLVAGSYDSVKVAQLSGKFGEFFKIFTYRMIWIGGPKDEGFYEKLQQFANDTLIARLRPLVDEKIDKKLLDEDLSNAFKHYRHYFPEKQVPEIVSCISGFNQSVVTSENLIGISLDKFLGSDCTYYSQLGLPEYKCRRMNPVNIVPETMQAWALTEFPKSDNSSNLLSNIIYMGKVMYFVDAMLPEWPDSLKIGYTEKQLKFCKSREAAMWTYLAEHKLLYSSQRMDIKHFIDDGPYTNSFTPESPGRTGVWLGWQIIRSYMKKNKEITLAQLMHNQNFQEILNKSGYLPQ